MIVHAANTNGISTAAERPNTRTSTSSATGSATASPRRRSADRIGSRSCWIAGSPVTRACGKRPLAQGGTQRNSPALRLLQIERRLDVAVHDPFVPVRSAIACPPGTALAASRRRAQARIARAEGSLTTKTTVKVPSVRSPKWRSRIVCAASESVPGTASELKSSAGSRAADSAPTTSTTSQQAITIRRRRRTARVHDSSVTTQAEVELRPSR